MWDEKKMAEEISRETQSSIAATSMFPGFRFSPTDVELISYYLKKKMEGLDRCVEVIAQIEFCKYEPWDLPGYNFNVFFTCHTYETGLYFMYHVSDKSS